MDCKVSAKTIRNDGEFAKNVDTLVETCGEEVKKAVLSDRKLNRMQVEQLAALPKEEQPEAVQKTLAAGKKPRNRKAARQQTAKPEQRSTITLPAELAELVEALLSDHGREFAGRVLRALEKALEPKEEANGKAEEKAKVRRAFDEEE